MPRSLERSYVQPMTPPLFAKRAMAMEPRSQRSILTWRIVTCSCSQTTSGCLILKASQTISRPRRSPPTPTGFGSWQRSRARSPARSSPTSSIPLRRAFRPALSTNLHIDYLAVLRTISVAGSLGLVLTGEDWGRGHGAMMSILGHLLHSPVSVPSGTERQGYRRRSLIVNKPLL